jgi:hypothetical protein
LRRNDTTAPCSDRGRVQVEGLGVVGLKKERSKISKMISEKSRNAAKQLTELDKLESTPIGTPL